jgi:hypothetical protein
MDSSDERERIIRDDLRSQLDHTDLLSTKLLGKSDTRPTELLHEVVCKKCGVPVLRLVQLDPLRVILFRTRKPNDEPWPANAPADWVQWYRLRKRSAQLDNKWEMQPLANDEPAPDASLHQLVSACKCTYNHKFTVTEVLSLEGGTSKISPPRRDQS